MKYRNKQRFDYTREPHGNFEKTEYGLHMRNGHLHIDTKRLNELSTSFRQLMPYLFDEPRNTHYFIPKKKFVDDYHINGLMQNLDWLEYEWDTTYAKYYKTLESPEDKYRSIRYYHLNMTTDSDAIDDIQVDAFVEAAKDIPLYTNRVLDLYYVYLEKIQQEFFNALSYMAEKVGYSQEDFTYRDFLNYFNGIIDQKYAGNKAIKHVEDCDHYKYFDFMNRLINFIKHKSIRSYQSLLFEYRKPDYSVPYRDEFRAYVIIKPKNRPYKNGDSAIALLKLPDDFIHKIINYYRLFSRELCSLLFDENYEEAKWNSEEFIYKKIISIMR